MATNKYQDMFDNMYSVGKKDNIEEDAVASPVESTSLNKYEKLFEDITKVDPATDTIPNVGLTDPTTRRPEIKDPGRLTPGRAAGAAWAGTQDAARHTVVGVTSMLELASMWEDMDAAIAQEKKVPFSYIGPDQIHFPDFLREKGITDPEMKYLTEDAKFKYRQQFVMERRSEWVEGLQKTREYVIDKWASDPEYLTSTGWIEDFIKMGPQIGMQVLAGLATGGTGGMALMFAQISGAKTESLLAQGADFKTAATAGLWDAAIQAPLERIGLTKLTKFMKTRSNLVAKMKEAIHVYGAEVLTEYAQAYPDAATEIWGKNPDASKMEMVGEFFDKILDPEFHKQGLKEGLIAGAWSLVIGGGAQIKNARADLTDESGGKNTEIDTKEDGVEVLIQDESSFVDVRNEAENVHSVENLLGVEGIETTEGAVTPDGVSISEGTNITDEQRTDQHQSVDAYKQVLGELAGEKEVFKFNTEIETAEARLQNLVGFYNDAVEDADPQGALQVANMMDEQAQAIIKSYGGLMEASIKRSKNKDVLPNPEHMSGMEAKVNRLQTESKDRIETQTKNLRNLEQESRQQFIDTLDTDKGLHDELITASVQSSRQARPKEAKLYNNVISEMKFRQAVGPGEYFSKTPMKKLINLRVETDLNDAITAENKNVSADVLARNEAVGRWINNQIDGRLEYDQVQLQGERITLEAKIEAKKQKEAAAKIQKAEAKPAVKTIERRKRGEVTRKRLLEERRLAGVAEKAETAARTVADQAKELHKPIPGPTRTEELEEAKKDKAARVAAISRQREEVEAHEPKGAVAKAKAILPKGIEFDAIGDGTTTIPKGQVQVTIKDKKRMADGSTIIVDPKKDVKKQLNEKEVQFTTFEQLKRPGTNWTIVTSDNPGSVDAAPKVNVLERSKLKSKLNKANIPFKLGRSKFGEAQEVPFVIPGMTRAEAKKLSDELKQSSFIVAEGNDVHFIEGGEVTTVKKSEMSKAKEGEDYTEIDGVKFTIPFFKDSILDTVSMQMDESVAKSAKSLFRAAAIRLPNGKVYEGSAHPTVMMENKAVEDHIMKTPVSELKKDMMGFVTHGGQFMNRNEASKFAGTKRLISEDFLSPILDQKHDANKAITVVDFDKMKLQEKMGTLEVMDSLEKEMKLGKYKFIFDKTKAEGIKTIFVTANGQYGKLQEVKNEFLNLARKQESIAAFEGEMVVDPKTGNMVSGTGNKGVYLKNQNAAIINLPIIGRSAKNLDQALETVVHEHVHALTAIAFENMTQAEKNAFFAELKGFWNAIPADLKRQLRDDENTPIRIRMGIIQVDKAIPELVSYSMAHPEFAGWLNSMPAPARFRAMSNKIKTMWDALVNLIVKKQLKVPSMLDELTDIFNYHLKFAGKQVRLSKGDVASFKFGENVDKETMEGWADEIGTQALNSMPVTIVNDKAEAEKILGFEIDEETNAIWTDAGDVIFRADRFDSQEKFISVWMHEQVAHQGLRNIFGKNTALFNRFLDQAYTLFSIKEAENLFKMAEIHKLGKLNKQGDMTYNLADRRLMAEELIARKAESLSPVTKKGLITRFKAFLKRWLPADFVGRLTTRSLVLSDKDIMGMLSVARENVFTGTDKFGELLDKALVKRAPKFKSLPGETMPKFMKSDATYVAWAEETLKAAPELKEWYSQHVETISDNFGPDADLFNVLLAVTSPQADVETNVLFAIKSYAYMLGLTDKPGALFPNTLQARIDNNWKTPKDMLADLESKNFKVTEFGRALLGDPSATVGDMWMFRLFYGDAAVDNKGAENFSIPQITGLRQKLHSLAAQLSAKTDTVWTPREVQAALWVNINAKQTGKSIEMVASYQTGLNKPSPTLGGKTPLQWINNLVPDLNKGPLSDAIGIADIPLAPISPLQKKLINQVSKDVVGKYPVSTKGVIKVLSPGVDNASTAKMIKAIVAGGREVTAQSDEMADWYQKVFGFEKVDDSLDMRLSDRALGLYTNDKGKVKFNLIRDNLSGFSGNYTMAVRFSKDAEVSMDNMAQLNSVEDDGRFLSTKKDQESHVSKIHVWRDQAARNIDRFVNQIEQEFLEHFGGRKSRVKGVGTGRWLQTEESERMETAMNLYIDSGTGTRLDKVIAFQKKLASKKDRTVAETEKLKVVDTMLNMSAGAKAWANEHIRPQYDQWFNFAKKNEIIETHIENYVKRTWKMSKEYRESGVLWNGGGNTGFKLTADSGKQRSIDSIIDGWEAGLELQTTGVIGNLQNYANEVSFVYANRRFVDYMRSLITPGSLDGVMVVRDSGVKPPEGFVKLTTRGFAKPGKAVYARADVGNMINKIGRTASYELWNKPFIRFMRRINAMLKSTLLSVTMFHHLAGLRSYVFGVRGTGWERFRPIKAYREGLRKLDEQVLFENPDYQHLGPIVDRLVQQGLTIGRVQDWDESAIMGSWVEEWLEKRTTPGAHMALHGWKGLRRQKRQITNGLFGQLFAGLKAQSAAVELTREISKLEKEHGRGLTDAEIDTEAERIAALINADFGGLHLERMGRDPDLQRIAQMTLLAPDWTESNWRTVTGMIPGVNKMIDEAIGDNPAPEGMGTVYRQFWRGIVTKGLVTVLAAQLAVLGLFGDDDDWDEYYNQLEEGLSSREGFAKARWGAVDVTPILKSLNLGPTDGRRTSLNVLGHFKDILKAATPFTLAKHKVSPLVSKLWTSVSLEDWKGDRFKSIQEIMDAPNWALTADPYKDPEEVHGWSAAMQQLVVASIYNVRGSLPIPLASLMQGAQGESTMLSAIGRAGGVDVRDVRHQDPNAEFYWKRSQDVQRLERNLKEAKLVKDTRMITQARQAIRNYDNFNRTKSRLGFARSRLKPLNKKIKAIELKQDRMSLSKSELIRLQDLKRRKAEVYARFSDVLKR